MRQEMRRDPKVVLMGEDVAGGADVDHLEGDEAWGGVLGVTKAWSRNLVGSGLSIRPSASPVLLARRWAPRPPACGPLPR
jgi:hypothetical protein